MAWESDWEDTVSVRGHIPESVDDSLPVVELLADGKDHEKFLERFALWEEGRAN